MMGMDNSLQTAITESNASDFSQLRAEKNVCAYHLWFFARKIAG
jgi:hypothetical protein